DEYARRRVIIVTVEGGRQKGCAAIHGRADEVAEELVIADAGPEQQYAPPLVPGDEVIPDHGIGSAVPRKGGSSHACVLPWTRDAAGVGADIVGLDEIIVARDADPVVVVVIDREPAHRAVPRRECEHGPVPPISIQLNAGVPDAGTWCQGQQVVPHKNWLGPAVDNYRLHEVWEAHS